MKQIDTIHAWVAFDTRDQTEGVCAFLMGQSWVPLVAADPERLASIRPMAEQICNESGMTLKLIRLSVREEIEEMRPKVPA
jgi:hypothetical protein